MSMIHLNPRLELRSFPNMIFPANFGLAPYAGQIIFHSLTLELRTVHAVLMRHKRRYAICLIVSRPLADGFSRNAASTSCFTPADPVVEVIPNKTNLFFYA